jgi:molecular chaperone DnaJ
VATDYYELLGVSPQASDNEIKRAYRGMARELHPDRTGGDATAEARFKEVTQAYEVLRDPQRRARYDRFGPEGADGSLSGAGDMFGGGLGDLFDAFFGGAATGPRRRGGPVRGGDAEIVLELDFREAVFGTSRELTLDTPVVCATCDGSGARAGTTAMRCPECEGAGEQHRVRQSILGQVVTAVPCRRCGGAGEVISSPCSDCRGDGRVTEARTFTVDVPAGVDHGSTLRLTGRWSRRRPIRAPRGSARRSLRALRR